ATINGAGATFPYPAYGKWAYAYSKETGVRLNYQSIGSGGGIKQIKAKTVDFGASDAPLKPAELDKFGLMQWPQIMGGVVPVVHLAGIGANQLKISAQNLADIYLGKITKWDDAHIKADNPGLNLPHEDITVVHRADGSGTTWIFTNYLTKVSKDWADKVGNAKSVAWPVGLGGKGNEGVAAFVRKVEGSIGYVEYAYALQNKMASVLLKNRDGHFVAPTAANFQAAAAGADWAHAKGYYMVLTNQPGANSWPITGASFILMYKAQQHPERAREVLKFFDWAFHHGQKLAESLDYVPMPEKVVKMIEATWRSTIKDTHGNPVWK
ncbi:MAG: phosphate ABC transporter substrate-binding protein PstS, partial [Alphaproteobacteria bacterium]